MSSLAESLNGLMATIHSSNDSMARAIKRLGEGDLKATMPLSMEGEYAELARHFNRSVASMDELVESLRETVVKADYTGLVMSRNSPW